MTESSRKEQEPGAIACAGKGYEHHESSTVRGDGRWECPACGGTGTFEAVFGALRALQPQLYHLRMEMLDQGAVFLLPSDATPGRLGSVFGHYDVYRLTGITEPMIALPASQISRLTMPRIALGPIAVLDALTGEQVRIVPRSAPAADTTTREQVEPLAADLAPYLDWPVWMRENGVTCERPDCQEEDCQKWGPVQVSESGHTTLRKILEGLKQHAANRG
jgi:hypothetical protein